MSNKAGDVMSSLDDVLREFYSTEYPEVQLDPAHIDESDLNLAVDQDHLQEIVNTDTMDVMARVYADAVSAGAPFDVLKNIMFESSIAASAPGHHFETLSFTDDAPDHIRKSMMCAAIIANHKCLQHSEFDELGLSPGYVYNDGSMYIVMNATEPAN